MLCCTPAIFPPVDAPGLYDGRRVLPRVGRQVSDPLLDGARELVRGRPARGLAVERADARLVERARDARVARARRDEVAVLDEQAELGLLLRDERRPPGE